MLMVMRHNNAKKKYNLFDEYDINLLKKEYNVRPSVLVEINSIMATIAHE